MKTSCLVEIVSVQPANQLPYVKQRERAREREGEMSKFCVCVFFNCGIFSRYLILLLDSGSAKAAKMLLQTENISLMKVFLLFVERSRFCEMFYFRFISHYDHVHL